MKILKFIQTGLIILIATFCLNIHLAAPVVADNFVSRPIPRPNMLPGGEISATDTETTTQNQFISNTLPRIAIGLTGFVGVLSVVMLIISGIRLTLTMGSDEQVDKAKSQIIYSIAGLIIALLAYTIVRIVINFDFSTPGQNTNTQNTNPNQEVESSPQPAQPSQP